VDETTSYVYNHARFYAVTPSLDFPRPDHRQPSTPLTGRGRHRNGPHVFKLTGMYQFPYEISLSQLQRALNFPFNPNPGDRDARETAWHGDDQPDRANTIHLPLRPHVGPQPDKASGSVRTPHHAERGAVQHLERQHGARQTARQNTSTANFLTSIVGPRVLRFGAR